MVDEKARALAVFRNIKAVLSAGLFFGEHATVINQCQVFIDELIAQNEQVPLEVVPDVVEEVADVQGE